jgi:hypothetical protein
MNDATPPAGELFITHFLVVSDPDRSLADQVLAVGVAGHDGAREQDSEPGCSYCRAHPELPALRASAAKASA